MSTRFLQGKSAPPAATSTPTRTAHSNKRKREDADDRQDEDNAEDEDVAEHSDGEEDEDDAQEEVEGEGDEHLQAETNEHIENTGDKGTSVQPRQNKTLRKGRACSDLQNHAHAVRSSGGRSDRIGSPLCILRPQATRFMSKGAMFHCPLLRLLISQRSTRYTSCCAWRRCLPSFVLSTLPYFVTLSLQTSACSLFLHVLAHITGPSTFFRASGP